MAKKSLPKAGKKYTELHEAVQDAVNQYESQAEAAREMEIGKTYLSRLLTGEKSNPSDDVLARLGITRNTFYTFG